MGLYNGGNPVVEICGFHDLLKAARELVHAGTTVIYMMIIYMESR